MNSIVEIWLWLRPSEGQWSNCGHVIMYLGHYLTMTQRRTVVHQSGLIVTMWLWPANDSALAAWSNYGRVIMYLGHYLTTTQRRTLAYPVVELLFVTAMYFTCPTLLMMIGGKQSVTCLLLRKISAPASYPANRGVLCLYFKHLLLLPMQTMLVGVGRIFESVCLFVCSITQNEWT